MSQLVYVLVVFLFIGGYYAYYMRKVKNAGGYGAIFDKINRDRWGLEPGEPAPNVEWTGEMYIGDLVPGSGPSTGEQVLGFLANTSYRGRLLAIAITPRNRLVVSAEPTDENKGKFDNAMGDMGYRPLLAFTPASRPVFVDPRQAFAGNSKLDRELGRGPKRMTKLGREVQLQLAVLQTPQGRPLAFWCEPDALPRLSAWCATGA